jgi:hypothetical protein
MSIFYVNVRLFVRGSDSRTYVAFDHATSRVGYVEMQKRTGSDGRFEVKILDIKMDGTRTVWEMTLTSHASYVDVGRTPPHHTRLRCQSRQQD